MISQETLDAAAKVANRSAGLLQSRLLNQTPRSETPIRAVPKQVAVLLRSSMHEHGDASNDTESAPGSKTTAAWPG